MKRLRYYNEKSLWLHIAIFILLESGLAYSIIHRENSSPWELYLLAAVVGIVLIIDISEGFRLLYAKRKCLNLGTQYKGRITGRFGHSTMKSGYFYQLAVLYKNGKIITPPIEAKYVDKLKYRRCTVHEYKGMTYVDGFTLCEKGDTPIDIQIIHKQNK